MRKKIVLSVFLVFLLSLNSSFMSLNLVSAATTTVNHLSFTKNSGTMPLDNNFGINWTNGDKSTIHVLYNNKTIYSEEVSLGYYEETYLVNENTQKYLIVTTRLDGSGSIYQFKIFKVSSTKLDLLYKSTEHAHGSINVQNNIIQLTYPVYEQNDSNASPSKEIVEKFTLDENGKLSSSSTEQNIQDTQQLQQKTNSFATTSETYAQRVARIAKTVSGKNPSDSEMNQIITKAALDNDIPPEILKAIAYQESGWNQFKSDGTPVFNATDGGLGLMQITNSSLSDDEIKDLLSSVQDNLQAGIDILLGKWNYGGKVIPTINSNEKSIIEDWYFAITAYNGFSKTNDPLLHPNNTYQDKIYSHMDNYGLVSIIKPKFASGEITYNSGSSFMNFKNSNYKVTGTLHSTTQNYSISTISAVTEDGVNVRTSPTSADSSNIGFTANKGDLLKIVGSPKYENNIYNQFVWYPVSKLDDSKVYYISSSYLNKFNISSYRVDLSGSSRYSTSANISKNGWPNGSDTVVIARGDIAVDGLAGSTLAKKNDAPLLLIQNDNVDTNVLTELKRLSPSNVIILGGTSAIKSSVESIIKKNLGDNVSISRVYGGGRYSTAVEIAKKLGNVGSIFIATGKDGSPDALSAGAAAASLQAPILLSEPNKLSDVTLDYIKNHKSAKIYLIGNSAVVPDSIKKQLADIGIGSSQIERVGGTDRYRTSTAIATKFFPNVQNMIFANGDSFIDALPGSPLGAKIGSPIILTKKDEVLYTVSQWIKDNSNNLPHFYFLGGTAVITDKTRIDIQQLIGENQ